VRLATRSLEAGRRYAQPIGKLTSNRRADLRHIPHRDQAVEPRQQRGVEARRDREWRQCAVEHVAVRFFAQQTALQYRFCQFLDKQRHAVSALGNLGDDFGGQPLAGDLFDQSGPVVPVEATERQRADLFLAGPGRRELGAKRHEQQYRHAADALDHQVEQLARGRVDPMRVLEDHDDRLAPRQAFELPDQRR